MIEINTDLGPIPIVVRESLPDGAVVLTNENADGTTSVIYSDTNGNAVEIGRFDYSAMMRDWMEYGDYLHSYKQGNDDD